MTQNINPIFTKLNISYTIVYPEKLGIRTATSKIPNLVINELDGEVIFGIKIDNNFTNIDNLIKILENKSNNLNIKNKFIMNNETLKLLMKDI